MDKGIIFLQLMQMAQMVAVVKLLSDIKEKLK
jgi:hypothetical protein